MKILGMSTVSGKHQIVVTREVFEKLKLSVGDKILWVEDEGRVYVKKAEIK